MTMENEQTKTNEQKVITSDEILRLCLESYAKGFHDAVGMLNDAAKNVTVEKLLEIRRAQVAVKE